MPKQTWIANYIYKDADGATRTGVRLVTAYTEQEAHDFAAQHPPAEEFVVSLHPQSDDQVLGSVRQNASRIKELREDDAVDGHALRDVLKMLLSDPDADIGGDIENLMAEREEEGTPDARPHINGKAGGRD